MAQRTVTRLEMIGDYIQISGPRSERELLDVLSPLISTYRISRRNGCPPMIYIGDGRTIMFVDADPEAGSIVTLGIGNLDHDDDARTTATRDIHQALASATAWRLTVSTDADQSPISGTDTNRRAC